ncbi:MAG: hypothetical protein HY744_13290 [Deltaproteobacteria bacterium]|nr:hypothetical protein [Deltaproteobacteria bacterium]
MPGNARRKPPGGKRVSRAEVERRMAEVERLALEGRSRSEIVAALRELGTAPSTTDAYLARVRDRWIADGEAGRPAERERAVARLRGLSRSAEARGAFGASVAAERLAAEILGLRAPERHEVTGDGVGKLVFTVEVPELSTEVRDAEAAARANRQIAAAERRMSSSGAPEPSRRGPGENAPVAPAAPPPSPSRASPALPATASTAPTFRGPSRERQPLGPVLAALGRGDRSARQRWAF